MSSGGNVSTLAPGRNIGIAMPHSTYCHCATASPRKRNCPIHAPDRGITLSWHRWVGVWINFRWFVPLLASFRSSCDSHHRADLSPIGHKIWSHRLAVGSHHSEIVAHWQQEATASELVAEPRPAMEIFPQRIRTSPATLLSASDIVSLASRGRARAREAGILPTLTAVRYVPRSIPCYDITLVYRSNAVSQR